MSGFKRITKKNRDEMEAIKRYFNECLPTIDDNNLHMLRKASMYISFVYIVMLIVGIFAMEAVRLSIYHFVIVPLIIIYVFINMYTLKHRGEISTAKTAAICCTFYFFLGVDLAVIDVFEAPAGRAIWLPIAVIGLPMIFIDRIYKYIFEESVVLSILLIMSYFHNDFEHFKNDAYISMAAFFISILSARIILEMRAKEALAMEEVTRLSALDKLTHVLNKNALLERIDNYFYRKTPEESCAMCIIDLDDFKLVNDNLGHNTGDLLLEKVGQLLIENFRAYDLVGRYGGDEFVVLMPRMSDINILTARCKTLQMYINDLDIGSDHRITASIGAVICKGNCDRKVIFSMADDALYKSKIQGKNCSTNWIYEEQESVDKDVLILMAPEKNQGVYRLYDGEEDRFKIVYSTNDDATIRDISRYRNEIKIVMVEVDTAAGLGMLVLKYLKRREGFAKLPVIAIVETHRDADIAKELLADAIIGSDEPDAKFREMIDSLIK